MSDYLPVRRNAQVALRKTKNLIGVTNRLLADKKTVSLTVDDSWIQRLLNWADENDVPSLFSECAGPDSDHVGLPRNKQQLINLKCCFLIDIPLSFLPPEIGRLVNLKKLCISFNQLTDLPQEIGQLVNLKTLNLLNTLLYEFPREIGQLVNLETLCLANDGDAAEMRMVRQWSELPPEIGQLVNLKHLIAANFLLLELPPEIGKLVNLKTLYLGRNQLTELPPEITQLTNLRSLDLRHNPLHLPASQREWFYELKENGCSIRLS